MSGGSDLREPVLQHLTGGLVADVQVDLGGGNAAVAQVFLDVAQLHPPVPSAAWRRCGGTCEA